MRKLLVTTVFACIIMTSTSAQIEKGTILIGASSNFGYNNLSPDNSSGYTILNVDLKAGYFVINNLTAGLNIGYSRIDDEFVTSIGAFTRYYIAGKFFLGAGYTSIKPSGSDASTEIPIELGFAAFVSENIALEPSVSYAMGDGYERFGLNIGFSLYFNR